MFVVKTLDSEEKVIGIDGLKFYRKSEAIRRKLFLEETKIREDLVFRIDKE